MTRATLWLLISFTAGRLCGRARHVAASGGAAAAAGAGRALRPDDDRDRGRGRLAARIGDRDLGVVGPRRVYVWVARRRRPGHRRRSPTPTASWSPSGSDAAELNRTQRAVPVFGSASACTVGASLPGGSFTVMVISSLVVDTPPASVTVTFAL